MAQLITKIRQSVIGDLHPITTPFGVKPLVYADYTASGRALTFIEEFIQQKVLPFYANTHTETSFTGAQTTQLREQARQQIKDAVNATDEDSVIFCGSGATACINKLIEILNLRLPKELDERYQLAQNIPAQQRPVVFIGPYEHHSNELPWRESICQLEVIGLTADGQLDMTELEEKLQQHQTRDLLIGSFSAASNVTGVRTQVDDVAALLHRYGALSFWDYAAAAPYVKIDVTGVRDASLDSSKDAVFISPHKFVGGPGTPGVLVVKKRILNNAVPAQPGGGTVMYVTPEDHNYVANVERREEAGTPAIVESIRAGLVFKLQQDVGVETIEEKEHDYVQRAIDRWQSNPNIVVLGNPDLPSLSITSLQIMHQGRPLHYGLVVAMLNDLFGIQARGGCSCAGPYGHQLLAMNMQYSKQIEAQLMAGNMIYRPGWTRLNFNYFIDESTFDYLLSAIELIAEHGWKLLPYYEFDQDSGVWRYQQQQCELPVSLSAIDFMQEPEQVTTTVSADLASYTQLAKQVLTQPQQGQRFVTALPESAEDLRWFAVAEA